MASSSASGYAGQVIVGSWYGSKPMTLHLGERYHRSHIRVRSSQVSQIDPDHADRWDKERRLDVVRSWLSRVDLPGLITHRMDIGQADEAYQLLDERRDDAVQVVFTYE
jgi:alcohol dehydrogenase